MFGSTTQKFLNEYSIGKLTVCGNFLEYKQFSKPIYKGSRIVENKKKKCDNYVKLDTNLSRARQNVCNLIYCNLTPYTKMLTLTTADICLDKNIFKRRLTTFLQAMKREGYQLKYLGVFERQLERGEKEGNIGSIHAHLIIFNVEKIPFEIINKHWKGFTEIRILDGLRYGSNEKINNVGAYVCKYITKEACNEWGSHSYFCSKGLNRPYSITDILYLCDDISNVNLDNREAIYSILDSSINTFSTIKEYKISDDLSVAPLVIKYERYKLDERIDSHG